MTRNDVLIMLADGGLESKFNDVDKSHHLVNGEQPDAYVVPDWLFNILEELQGTRPTWKGRRLDPWGKDEIRGQ